jgi:hypothetical protein
MSSVKHIATGLLVLLFLVLATDVAHAKPWRPSPPAVTKWVSASGGGTGCTEVIPCTLATALSTANPGDVFGLNPGTYDSGSNRTVSRGGSSTGGWITFRATDPANPPLLRYTGTSTTPGSSYPYIFQIANGVNYVRFYDLHMQGNAGGGAASTWAGAGIKVGVGGTGTGAHHIGVYGTRMSNFSGAGIAMGPPQGDYFEAIGNEIWHTGYNANWSWSSGISLWRSFYSDTAPGFHSLIVGNVLSGHFDAQEHTDGNGIIVDLQGSGGNPPVLIANNIMFGNGGRAFQATGSQRAWVVNNTAYKNQLDPAFTEAEAFGAGTSGVGNQRWINNIARTIPAAGHEGFYLSSEAQSTSKLAGNLHYGHSVPIVPTAWNTPDRVTSGNPLFTAPPTISDTAAATDTIAPWALSDDAFLPSTGSPAIDGGINPATHPDLNTQQATTMAEYLSRDVFGNQRVGATDIGAVEVQSTDPEPTPTPTPTSTPTPTPTPSPTPTPTPAPSTVVEGESMTRGNTGRAQVRSDTNASGGQTMFIYGATYIERTISVSPPTSEIRVRVRGDQCNGAPPMTVSVDGTQRLSTTVSNTGYADKIVPVTLSSGSHTVRVTMPQDRYNSSSCDWNLWVDKATFIGSGTPSPTPTPTPSPTPTPTPTADPQPVGPTAGTLAFRDEFSGSSVDWNKWTDTSHAESDAGHGNPGNQQLEWNHAANCSVSNGTLKETAKEDRIVSPQTGRTYNWSSCQIASTPSYSFRYGVIEMRAKLPAPTGFWTALWTWQVPGYNVWNEIDVFENYSNDHNWLSMSSHAGSGGNCTLANATSADLSAGMHTYTAAITASGTRFYLDGQQTCSVAGTHTGLSNILVSNFVYDHPTLHPSSGAVGVLEVDYVRAWRMS